MRGVERDADARLDLERRRPRARTAAASAPAAARRERASTRRRRLGSSTANSSPPSRATVSLVAQRLAQRAADLAQQQVAAVVAERVVDLLEAVEVDACITATPCRRAGAARSACCDAVVEERAVRQPGERVVERLVLVRLRLAPQPLRRALGRSGRAPRTGARARRERRRKIVRVSGEIVPRDRLVGEIDLEGAGGLARRSEVQWENTSRSRRTSGRPRSPRSRAADLRSDLVGERLAQLVRRGEATTHELSVVRVDHPAVAVPDLHARDLVPDQVRTERLVDGGESLGCEAVPQVGRDRRG